MQRGPTKAAELAKTASKVARRKQRPCLVVWQSQAAAVQSRRGPPKGESIKAALGIVGGCASTASFVQGQEEQRQLKRMGKKAAEAWKKAVDSTETASSARVAVTKLAQDIIPVQAVPTSYKTSREC